MNSIWATSLLAAFAAIALTVAFQFIKGRRLKARLKRLRDMREEPKAFDRCKAQFPQIPHARVQAAYVWVQELVGVDNLPLHPEDDLSETLEVNQGSVDDKFEASYECYGKEQDSGIAAGKQLRTVKDLMAAVLASGYESYPGKKSHTEFHDAAQPFLQADVPTARRLSQTLGRSNVHIRNVSLDIGALLERRALIHVT